MSKSAKSSHITEQTWIAFSYDHIGKFFITSSGVNKMSHFFTISLITSSVSPCKISKDTTGTASKLDKEHFNKSSLSF